MCRYSLIDSQGDCLKDVFQTFEYSTGVYAELVKGVLLTEASANRRGSECCETWLY